MCTNGCSAPPAASPACFAAAPPFVPGWRLRSAPWSEAHNLFASRAFTLASPASRRGPYAVASDMTT
jgi:hypothetical protein